MKALILAAGYGTRLKALGANTPKALLKVGNKPLADHILDRLRPLDGLEEVLVVTNEKFYEAFREWSSSEDHADLAITIVNDGTRTPEDRLGSIGDIAFAIQHERVEDDLLVVGGDNLFDYNLQDFITFARQKAPAISLGLYDIHSLQEATKFGVVEVDGEGRVVSFEEKPARPKSSLVAMCFYYLPKASLGLIDEYLRETKVSDTAGDYIRWLHKNHHVYGFQFTGTWYDIGSLEAYQEAQQKFKNR